MENKADNRTENKIGKVTVDFVDGGVKEVSGESIILISLTDEGDLVNVECLVEGGFSVDMIIGVIRSMQDIFKDKWTKAMACTRMVDIFGKMFADEEQHGEPNKEPTGEPAAEGGNHEDD